MARAANSALLRRWRRALSTRLPFLVLQSDVRDVVYLTWLVDVAAVAALVPPGVTLQQKHGKTPFTVLTYAHRHFGPAAMSKLRRLFPSPLQSNWRLYVETLPGHQAAERVVLFVKNLMDSALYALSTRLGSDALPTHLPLRFRHEHSGSHYATEITAGTGSAPELRYLAQLSAAEHLPPGFDSYFASWTEAVTYLCLQDAAIAPVHELQRLAYAEIALPIDMASVRPLALVADSLHSDFVQALTGAAEPLCFVVPSVHFKVLSEHLL
ncbi:DUF2071 domain-containing protein [Dyella silvatica]|uniref:DUF2071 domain-containing protein n=1 Tax=Dyella silvatica TaxID=2992128 RepID=UPI00225320F5|nr:DUF2071 domain-containing protein [Dyella silvatica]